MPRKNNAKYQRKFCKLIINHFERGGSVKTLPAYLDKYHGIDICRATLYNWAKQHPEFGKKLQRGQEIAEMNLEYLLQADVVGKAPKDTQRINAKSLYYSLKRFSEKEKSESAGQVENSKIVIVRAKDAD